MVAVVVEDVADEPALLEQGLAAIEVADEGVGLVRPRYLRVEVRAGEVFLAGQAHLLAANR